MYEFEIKNIKFICDYDKNIRGGLKIDIDTILRDGKFEKLVGSDKVSESEIDKIVELYNFNKDRIKIIKE